MVQGVHVKNLTEGSEWKRGTHNVIEAGCPRLRLPVGTLTALENKTPPTRLRIQRENTDR